ncbi:MAG: L,D-transpeptidase [Anaerolineales bacterium]|nr:L,D-transpeptidase [Anaerolineales bacterium]
MKRMLFSIISLVSILLGNQSIWMPAAASQSQTHSSPVVLCLPGIYLTNPLDCIPAGPSSYLTQMARKGLTFPLLPLAVGPIDPALSQVDVRYAEVQTQGAPIYGSLDEASKNNRKSAAQKLNGEFVFVSYTDETQINNRKLYQVGPNQWMVGADLSRLGVLPASRGVTFSRAPLHAFGWVLTYWVSEPLQTKRTPGNQTADYTGRILNLYDIVPVYGEEKVGEEIWYMISPEEWVPQKYIARVTPNTTPPAGVTGDRWIEVNLFEQTLAVYERRQLVFATIIASGADPFWTQPGVFQIQTKLEKTPMRGASESGGLAYYLEDVPWTMYYDGPRALHGAYWRAKMGFVQSHGCINLTVGDAHWLFNWAVAGDWVYVWDPSGQTPTDPKLYGSIGF